MTATEFFRLPNASRIASHDCDGSRHEGTVHSASIVGANGVLDFAYRVILWDDNEAPTLVSRAHHFDNAAFFNDLTSL
jgi:hypothetical protein